MLFHSLLVLPRFFLWLLRVLVPHASNTAVMLQKPNRTDQKKREGTLPISFMTKNEVSNTQMRKWKEIGGFYRRESSLACFCGGKA